MPTSWDGKLSVVACRWSVEECIVNLIRSPRRIFALSQPGLAPASASQTQAKSSPAIAVPRKTRGACNEARHRMLGSDFATPTKDQDVWYNNCRQIGAAKSLVGMESLDSGTRLEEV
ncbi:unnamed protein product [Parajaminaea phylloscopi]